MAAKQIGGIAFVNPVLATYLAIVILHVSPNTKNTLLSNFRYITQHIKPILWLAILLAILLRIEHRYHFRKWTADTAVQLAIVREDSKQEMDEFYMKVFNPVDLANPLLVEETGFMHGYSYLLAALPFRGKSLLDVSFVMDILAIILLTVSIFFMLVHLRASTRTLLYFLIFWAFALPPLHYLPAVDLFSLAFFITGCLLLLRNWQKGGVSYAYMLVFWGIAAFMRNAFLPFIVLPPLLASWLMWKERKVSLRHSSAFLFTALVIISLLALNKVGGYHFGVMDGELYFSHVLYLDPFPFKSLFYFGRNHVEKLAAYSPLLPQFVNVICLLISLGLIWVVIQPLVEFRRKKNDDENSLYLWRLSLLCGLVMMINVGMLLFLSLTSPPENWNEDGFWTFVMETRYFAPTMLLMLIIFFVKASEHKKWKGQAALRMLIIAAMIINTSFSLWLKFEVNVMGHKHDTFPNGPIPALLDMLERESTNGKGEVLITSEQNIRAGEILNTSLLPIEWFADQESLPTSKSVQIWLLAHESPTVLENRLLEKWPFMRKSTLGESGLVVYTMELSPS